MTNEEKKALIFLKNYAMMGIYHESWSDESSKILNKELKQSLKIIRGGLNGRNQRK